MAKAGHKSGQSVKLKLATLRVSKIGNSIEQARTAGTIHDWDKLPRLRNELESAVRKVVSLAKRARSLKTLELYLVTLCNLVAEKDPHEALRLTKMFDDLRIEHEDIMKLHVAEARHIAYKRLGQPVKARQHGAIAHHLRNEVGKRSGHRDASLMDGLRAALRSSLTPLAESEPVAIKLSKRLDSWLAEKSSISVIELAPYFGEFVSNDRRFYRAATELLEMLSLRLKGNLINPDNYLLHAEPGSGKSFFVRQFVNQLQKHLAQDITFLERNLSAYSSIEVAFTDVVTDVLIALIARQPVLLFVDEVDTRLDGRNIFQRLIAPMNGDPFFFLQKQVSFAKQNLVVFFALSGKAHDVEKEQKWPDFLSRVPAAHQISLPGFNDPLDRIFRAVAALQKGAYALKKVEAAALLYVGLCKWTSVRELEQALDAAKMRAFASSSRVLELAHIALSPQDVDVIENDTKIKVFGGPINVLEII